MRPHAPPPKRKSERRPPAWLFHKDLWFSAGLAGLALLMVLLFVNNRANTQRTANAAATAATAKAIAESERNTRIAEKRAGIKATYQACRRSVPTLRNATEFVDAVTGLAADLVENAKRNHAATPRSNPQWQAQRVNIANLHRRYVATTKLRFHTPTLPKCVAARDEALAALAESTSRPDQAEADRPPD